jgi:GNAT superfamily N-acetyltransferase
VNSEPLFGDAEIRTLTAGDVSAALHLSMLAGWNQTSDDWHMLLQLAPRGCFAVEVDGQVVATATLLCYGDRLGWIGMVLTHPEYRHRGYAKQLFAHVLAAANALGVRTLKLDATEQGRPLYERYGFKAEQAVERWYCAVGKNVELADSLFEVASLFQPDRRAFGTDRSDLLNELASRGHALANGTGFALTRPGSNASYLGPCVAEGAASASDLIKHAVLHSKGKDKGYFWDLLPANRNAVSLATELGFSPQRRLTRMSRGEELRGEDDLVYAIAGFELG